uniref:Uncharacterized protein MANES_05G126100 n=1 Tax=Rhizophora mucronata TaxID=61149 RepID=A0A2P2JUK7_RHIMU
MASFCTLQSQSFSTQPPSSSIWVSRRHLVFPCVVQLSRRELLLSYHGHLTLATRPTTYLEFHCRAINGEDRLDAQNDMVKSNSKEPFTQFQGMIKSAVPPVVFVRGRWTGSIHIFWLCIATAFVVIAWRQFVVRKSRYKHPGSVADLVRRGQLRSDRRGISRPLKYEDPFNNPLVKASKSDSTIEMCGKVYRLAPVTLTKDQQAVHQKRRSRAYQWKRPTVFLKEGDSIPSDIDPETVRWIPANHPFATTASEIDEDLAQTNVYQKDGVPFRIQAEHEALQRKLEALQNDQKLNGLFIDKGNARDFERPFRLSAKINEVSDQSLLDNQAGDSKPSESDSARDSSGSGSSSDEKHKL